MTGDGSRRTAAVKRKGRSPFVKWMGEFGWRHLVAAAVLVFGLVPIVYVVSAAFNPNGTLSSTSLLPTSFGFGNFQKLFTDPNVPFGRWFLNSIVIAVPAAFISIFISSLAAYASAGSGSRGGGRCCCSCC